MKIKLLVFLFIAAIAMIGSASAYTYDADAKMGASGFDIVYATTDGEFETIVDGINYINTNNTERYQYRYTTTLDPETGYTITLGNMQVYDDTTGGGITIYDGTYSFIWAFGGVDTMYVNDQSIDVTTTDTTHTYNFTRLGTSITIYQDDIEIFNATSASLTVYSRIDIGESSTSYKWNVSIDYLNVGDYYIPSTPEEPVEEYNNPFELNYDDWSGLEYNDTIVTYRNITLKNGWNPANEWWGTSGGGWTDNSQDSSYRAGILFTATTNQTVTDIGLVRYLLAGNPVYQIGLQYPDENGYPDGTYINGSYGLYYGNETVVNQVNWTGLSSPVDIVENTQYCIAITPYTNVNATNYVTFKGMKSPDGDVAGNNHNGFMPSFNYGGYDSNVAIRDAFYWAVQSYNSGSDWGPGENNRESPNFVLNFSDGDQFGAVALHDYEGVSGPEYKGEKIVIHNGNKTVDSISGYFWENIEDGVTYPYNTTRPNDSLYYYIQDSEHNNLRTGVFMENDFFDDDYDPQWHSVELSSPLELVDGETYYVVWNSPLSNSTVCYYGNDASGPVYFGSWSHNLSYGGSESMLVVSNAAGSSWTEYPQNDYSFGLHLVNVTTGTVIMPVINCTDDNVSSNVTISGIIPDGTSIDIYARYSSDNSTFGDYSLIQESASIGTAYTTHDSSQYIQLMAVMETDDSDTTPEISSLSVQISDTVSEYALSIVYFTGDEEVYYGYTELYSITVNKEANISVYLDSVLVQTNTSVTAATYVNDSMTIGTHNLTMFASVGGESVNRVWTVTVSEYVAPSEDTISLDLTVQQIITAIILGGLIPLVIVTVILFSNLNNIQIDNSEMVTVMIIIAVILVLTVVILNPLVEWI